MSGTAPVLPSPNGRRLVLCFDGTSNKFTGDETDTNIVKIYEMLDRTNDNQWHYYQPGIGSYVQGQICNTSRGNMFTQIKTYCLTSWDMMMGGSFVHHVIAGYEFLMKFYQPGDKIYIFGFSRGAYTARFLSEMVFHIGLLSRGNEEMVQFAWGTFSDFQRTRGTDAKLEQFMLRFKETFCREQVVVHFLGLFDCVNSVAQFQVPLLFKASPYIPNPPATHIRHAVSIHERRLMFKPALMLVDPCVAETHEGTIEEVYFAGNHGDVGGGWHCEGAKYLLSDIALKWMVEEVINLPDDENKLAWQRTKVDHMEKHEEQLMSVVSLQRIMTADAKAKTKTQPLSKLVHDPLAFGRGLSYLSTLTWWVLECLPIGYFELNKRSGQWEPQYWPPNLGSTRDIPADAKIHSSVQQLRRSGILSEADMPKLGGDEPYDPLVVSAWRRLFSWRKKPAPLAEPLVTTITTSTAEETANGESTGESTAVPSPSASVTAVNSGAKIWTMV